MLGIFDINRQRLFGANVDSRDDLRTTARFLRPIIVCMHHRNDYKH